MPHFFRLQPSTIPDAGVGVFATADILAGTVLSELFADDDVRWLTTEEFAALNLPGGLDHYFIPYQDGYSGPRDFNRLSVGWYLNHADAPNLGHIEWDYYALRDIAAGEELFIDYEQLWPG